MHNFGFVVYVVTILVNFKGKINRSDQRKATFHQNK